MSASRDEKTGKWTAQCYYENWKGEKKHKKKRGFATKKEALEWEREFLKSTSANMDMMLGAFVDVYFRDKAGELKERTIKNKRIVFVFRPKVQLVSVRLSHFLNLFTWVIIEIVNVTCMSK